MLAFLNACLAWSFAYWLQPTSDVASAKTIASDAIRPSPLNMVSPLLSRDARYQAAAAAFSE